MNISALGSSPASGLSAQTTSKTKLPDFGQVRSMTDSMLVSLLPSTSSSLPGIGGNLDIYAAVGKQSQGFLSGGLTGLELANISLGIDMSQTGANAGTDDSADPVDASTQEGSASPAAPSHTNTILNDILKAGGYTAPAENPYAVQTDFFANPGSTAGAATQYFSNADLSNPGLGGLLNSMG